jgi:hypothetical protein
VIARFFLVIIFGLLAVRAAVSRGLGRGWFETGIDAGRDLIGQLPVGEFMTVR